MGMWVLDYATEGDCLEMLRLRNCGPTHEKSETNRIACRQW